MNKERNPATIMTEEYLHLDGILHRLNTVENYQPTDDEAEILLRHDPEFAQWQEERDAEYRESLENYDADQEIQYEKENHDVGFLLELPVCSPPVDWDAELYPSDEKPQYIPICFNCENERVSTPDDSICEGCDDAAFYYDRRIDYTQPKSGITAYTIHTPKLGWGSCIYVVFKDAWIYRYDKSKIGNDLFISMCQAAQDNKGLCSLISRLKPAYGLKIAVSEIERLL